MNMLTPLGITAIFALLCSCAQLPKDYEAERTTAVTGTEDTVLGLRSIAERQGLINETRLISIVDGVDAFYARVMLVVAADRSLDLQYFIWHSDVTGQVLLKYLLDAADRGVRVRLLLDDFHSGMPDQDLYALDKHPNISIRFFNPFANRIFKYADFLTDPARVNRRMHNKSLTADNQYAIIGGRNIGDEYFDAQESSNFHDFDALITGPVVQQISTEFDEYWNHETAVPISIFQQSTATSYELEKVRIQLAQHWKSASGSPYADEVSAAQIVDALRGDSYPAYVGIADVVWDDPDKGLGKPPDEIATMRDHLTPYLDAVENELILISPYYVPNDRSVQKMIEGVQKGVSIILITNSYGSTDSSFVHAGYSKYRERLLAGGVKIYELKPTSRFNRRSGSVADRSEARLHTKMFIFDRKTVFMGSANLDPRSININTEMGIVFQSPDLAAALTRVLEGGERKNVYELKLEKPPAESQGESTVTTSNIEWLERIDGKTIRHTSEPGVGAWESFILFFSGLAPESQI